MGIMYRLTVQQGLAAIKQKIKSGEVDPSKLVVVGDEVNAAKKAIAGKPGGLTDEELHRAVIEISHKCGLKTDQDSVVTEVDEEKETPMGLFDRMNFGVMKMQSVSTKDMLLSLLGSALESLAHSDIKKGKLNPNTPYDYKPNAYRIIAAWRRNSVTRRALKHFNVSDSDLQQIIRNALVTVGFKEIKE